MENEAADEAYSLGYEKALEALRSSFSELKSAYGGSPYWVDVEDGFYDGLTEFEA